MNLFSILSKLKISKRSYTIGGLFSGIGGIELGFKQAGFDILWANEYDKYACLTYENNFKHTLIKDDIRNLNPNKLPKVDILVGGFPCQTFSKAGRQEGFDDKDKGQMFFEVVRFVKALKPKVIFLENVKNLKEGKNGKNLNIVLNELKKLQYHVHYQILDTCKITDIPQHRERIYFVCFKDKKHYDRFQFPKETDKVKDFKTLLEKKIPEDCIYDKNRVHYKEWLNIATNPDYIYQRWRKTKRIFKNGIYPTLTTHLDAIPILYRNDCITNISTREALRLQGFPESFKFEKTVSKTQKYKQIGNAVTVTVIKKIALQIKKALKD